MQPNDVTVFLIIILSLSPRLLKAFEYDLVQAKNIQRQALLKQKCDAKYKDNSELYKKKSIHTMNEADLEHLLIDRKRKVVYCYIEKVSFVFEIDL